MIPRFIFPSESAACEEMEALGGLTRFRQKRVFSTFQGSSQSSRCACGDGRPRPPNHCACGDGRHARSGGAKLRSALGESSLPRVRPCAQCAILPDWYISHELSSRPELLIPEGDEKRSGGTCCFVNAQQRIGKQKQGKPARGFLTQVSVQTTGANPGHDAV